VETHLTILLPELARRGYPVSLLTGSVAGEPAQSQYRGATVIRTPAMSLDHVGREDGDKVREEFTSVFAGFVESFKPDLVHAHNFHFFSRPHAEVLSEACRKKGIPLVLTAHNAWDDICFLELTRDIPWDHIIAVSHFIKRELISAGADDRKITVIHHGIDLERFHPRVDPRPILRRYPELAGKPVVFHPARMGLAKGNDVAVKAFHRVLRHFPDAVLVLAGSERIVDWENTQQAGIRYVLDLIRHFDMKKQTIIGVFSIEEMPAMYAASTIVLYPSTAPEPFGLTLLEAPAVGKPIVVSNVGGMPEIIRDGINGFIVPLRDSECLAERIVQLLGDARLRERIGMTGLAIVRDHYHKELMTDNHVRVYQQLLAGRPLPRESSLAAGMIPAAGRPLAGIPLYNQ